MVSQANFNLTDGNLILGTGEKGTLAFSTVCSSPQTRGLGRQFYTPLDSQLTKPIITTINVLQVSLLKQVP